MNMYIDRSILVRFSSAIAGIFAFIVFNYASSTLGQNSAPSSHFVFDDNFAGDIVINKVRIPKKGEALYTYYEVLGWRGRAAGYAGLQSHPRGHNYIFSIWDHKEQTAPIRAVHRGPSTLTEKFGGEGTGLKSWNFELDWETETWYTLVSRCWPVGDHTHYGYWVRSGKTKQWTHLVTMDVAAKEAWFEGGTDAFIEDWLATGSKRRETNLRDGWKRKVDGQWHPFGTGRYSVNSWDLKAGKRSYAFRNHWDGGINRDDGGEFYFMVAGGRETQPKTANPSRHTIERSEDRPKYSPIKIKDVMAHFDDDGAIHVTWNYDDTSLPQFAFSIALYNNLAATGEPVVQLRKVNPQDKMATVRLPNKVLAKEIAVRISCRDILDNESIAVTVPATKGK